MFVDFPVLKLHLHQSVHPIVQGKKKNAGSFSVQSVNGINFLPNLIAKNLYGKFRSISGDKRAVDEQSVWFVDRNEVFIPVNYFQQRNR